MNKLKHWSLVLFLFIMFTTPNASLACTCGRLSEADSRAVVDAAFFIGIVKTVDVEVVSEQVLVFTVEPIMAYKNSYDEVIQIKRVGYSSCAKSFPKEGALGERIIFKKHDEFHLAEVCQHNLAKEMWKSLRQTEPSEKFLSYQRECNERGGEIVFENLLGVCSRKN